MNILEALKKLFSRNKLKGVKAMTNETGKVLAIGKNFIDSTYFKKLLLWDAYYRNDFYNVIADSQLSLNPFYNDLQGKVVYPGAKKVTSKLSKTVFSDMPLLDVNDKSQERFEDIMMENNGFVKLRKGAEWGSALGKVYIKVSIDKNMDYPLFDVVYALNGQVTGRKWGVATEGIFYTYINTVNSVDYWLAEIYSEGKIQNKLMKGNVSGGKSSNLKEVPLDTLPDTEDLEEEVSTGVSGTPLFIEVVSPTVNNQNPESYEGMSIFANAISQLDDLNELVNDYYAEYKHKKVKAFYSEDFLPKDDKGNLKSRVDESVFVATDLDPSTVQNGKVDPIWVFDPPFRHEGFAQGLKDKMSLLYEACELSASTASKSHTPRTGAKTATEVKSEQVETTETKGDYQNVWRNALKRLMYLLLELDNVHYGQNHPLDYANVKFSDEYQDDEDKLSEVVMALRQKGEISRKTTLEILLKWDVDRIKEEEDALEDERVKENVNLEGMFMGKRPAPPIDDNEEE